MNRPVFKARGRRGSVLVFVLALIVLLSILAMRLLDETMQEIRHVSQFHRRDNLDKTPARNGLTPAVGRQLAVPAPRAPTGTSRGFIGKRRERRPQPHLEQFCLVLLDESLELNAALGILR